MMVMPSSHGWFFHCLARETGKIGQLYSPGRQRGPWPWLPYALDNGAFSCWDQENNTFDFEAWAQTQARWSQLLFWATSVPQRPMWAIVPDVPGNAEATMRQWKLYAPLVKESGIPLAIAVQDGMTIDDVLCLYPHADVVCVGGTTEWKWATAEQWCKDFARVHVLRCNSADKLYELEEWGCESTDGSGWAKGDRKRMAGLESWARRNPVPTDELLSPHFCRERCPNQTTFA